MLARRRATGALRFSAAHRRAAAGLPRTGSTTVVHPEPAYGRSVTTLCGSRKGVGVRRAQRLCGAEQRRPGVGACAARASSS